MPLHAVDRRPSPPAVSGGFLFVPVSGPGGAGEYFRALSIAHGVRSRWPDAPLRFLLNRAAPYAQHCPYPTGLLEDSPTRDVRPVLQAIDEQRPDVVVFDSAGRVAQFAAARARGALCVYISSRPKTRWKGFKLSRLRVMDEHWIVAPDFLGLGLTPVERLKLWLYPTVRVRFLPTFFDAPTEAGAAAVRERLGIAERRYALCCPGGAGQFRGKRSGAEVYARAAADLALGTGLPVVLVGADSAAPGVIGVGSLPNDELMALVGGAEVALVNGGSLLMQCLAQGAAVVAAPIAGDQQTRIRACARQGLVRAARFDEADLVRVALALVHDRSLRDAQLGRVAALGLKNGVDLALAALDERLTEVARRRLPPVPGR